MLGNRATAKTMSEPGKLKIDDILRTVADYYGVECEGVMSKSKSRDADAGPTCRDVPRTNVY